jgi:tetratricopeptide (TPR) repeat protein
MRKTILLTIVLALMGCSETDQKLSLAIAASRDGLGLLSESKHEEGRMKLLEAKKLYAELVHVDPQNSLYNNNYGWVLMKLGDYEEAEKYLTIADQNEKSIFPRSAPNDNLKELQAMLSKQ